MGQEARRWMEKVKERLANRLFGTATTATATSATSSSTTPKKTIGNYKNVMGIFHPDIWIESETFSDDDDDDDDDDDVFSRRSVCQSIDQADWSALWSSVCLSDDQYSQTED